MIAGNRRKDGNYIVLPFFVDGVVANISSFFEIV